MYTGLFCSSSPLPLGSARRVASSWWYLPCCSARRTKTGQKEEQAAAAAFPARAPPLQRKAQREARPTCPPNTAHQKQPTVFPSLFHFPFQPTQHTTLLASSLPPFNPLNVSLCSPSDSAYLFSSLQPSSPLFTLKSADFSLLCRRFSRFGIPAPVHTTPPPFASLRRSGIILQNSLYSPKLTFVDFDSATVVFLCLCSFPHRGKPFPCCVGGDYLRRPHASKILPSTRASAHSVQFHQEALRRLSRANNGSC